MKIAHFRDKCIGCNSCVEHSPEDWYIDEEDGKARLKDSEKKKDVYCKKCDISREEQNREASADCPVDIIKCFD